ncbi:MAG: DNA-processing protein DprA [Clostridiales bacterium]|nr:DNA-processing protein DprA [Clostridiales bacterium]
MDSLAEGNGRGARGFAGQACELKYWFWLGALTGLSARRAKMLSDAFGNPYEVWIQSADALCRLGFMNRQSVAQVMNSGIRGDTSRAMAAIQARGIDIVPLCDSQYPEHIRAISDPPLVLFRRGCACKGRRSRAVAIVGSRHPTAYGVHVARMLAGGLAARGLTIVSGMAMGIDAAAHAEALAVGGKTVAFLGCGVERAYPAGNRRLMDEIVRRGEAYSEFMPGTLPMQQNFPQRNRLISGMSAGVVVVEANERSGALITAGFAGEQGRDVFAVPGNINSPQSRGTNALIRDGAIAVTSADDVLEALNPFLAFCGAESGMESGMESGVDGSADGSGGPGQGAGGTAWHGEGHGAGGVACNGGIGGGAGYGAASGGEHGVGNGAGRGADGGDGGGSPGNGENAASEAGAGGARRAWAGGGMARNAAAHGCAARNGGIGGGAARGKPGLALAELDQPSRAIARMLLEQGPLDMDSIIAGCGLSAGAAGSTLVLLELKGIVRSLPGDIYEIA